MQGKYGVKVLCKDSVEILSRLGDLAVAALELVEEATAGCYSLGAWSRKTAASIWSTGA
jgi:hypothetical protein